MEIGYGNLKEFCLAADGAGGAEKNLFRRCLTGVRGLFTVKFAAREGGRSDRKKTS